MPIPRKPEPVYFNPAAAEETIDAILRADESFAKDAEFRNSLPAGPLSLWGKPEVLADKYFVAQQHRSPGNKGRFDPALIVCLSGDGRCESEALLAELVYMVCHDEARGTGIIIGKGGAIFDVGPPSGTVTGVDVRQLDEKRHRYHFSFGPYGGKYVVEDPDSTRPWLNVFFGLKENYDVDVVLSGGPDGKKVHMFRERAKQTFGTAEYAGVLRDWQQEIAEAYVHGGGILMTLKRELEKRCERARVVWAGPTLLDWGVYHGLKHQSLDRWDYLVIAPRGLQRNRPWFASKKSS